MSSNIQPGIYIISGDAKGQVNSPNLGDYGYFGLSVHPEKRLEQHLSALRRGTHNNDGIQTFYDDFGKNQIIYNIVEECDLDQLAKREKFYIEGGNTYKNPLGFNLTAGGEGVSLRDGKFFSFQNTDSLTYVTGQNIAMFWRFNQRYELEELYKLSRGEIQHHQNLIRTPLT